MLSSPPAAAARLGRPPLRRRRPLATIAASAIVSVAAAAALGASGCDGDRRAVGAGGAGGKGGGAGGSTGGAIAWQWTVSCPGGREPTSPIDYGRCAIDQALLEQRASSPSPSGAGGATPVGPAITVATVTDRATTAAFPDALALVDARPESFVIVPASAGPGGFAGAAVIGRDEVGAMYGALELAERIRQSGVAAATPSSATRGAPSVAFRAANLFWTVQDTAETEWWFHDLSFWRQYLDLLAHARLDVLDLHAMYDPSTTVFPNALVYLARSASHPEVGVPAADRDRNMATLEKVVTMARARGIRVGLMTYQASTRPDGNSKETLDDEALKVYDREAAADLAARVPGLGMFGFRIGESGKPATWYIDSMVAGARQSNPSLSLYTRTWVSNKNDISKLAAAIGPNVLVEAKFNGEQLGPPYAVAGGYFGTTYEPSYTYQNYLTPPSPWAFVFQVRAAGTHRIFRQVSYERTRRAVMSLGALSPRITGFTVEGTHAYAQQRDDYHAKAEDRLSPFTFLRDDLMYLLWGRLGYDPNTPESVFRAIAAREAGTDRLWDAMQAASDIVPWIQTAHTCGPDHRDFEPEMELGGDVAQWAELTAKASDCNTPGAFDPFAVAVSREAAADLVAGRPTSRVSPADVAAQVLADAERVEMTLRAAAADDPTAEVLRDGVLARDIARESQALADLGRHFGHKLRAATALAVYSQTGTPAWLTSARAETAIADAAWRKLADDTGYIKPFHERLRMSRLGYDPFHWSKLVPALDADGKALDAMAARVAASPPAPPARSLPNPDAWLASPRPPGPGLASLAVTPAIATATTWDVAVRFASPLPAEGAAPGPNLQNEVNVLWKPFDSHSDWSSVPAYPGADGTFTATVAGGGEGALFAVELRTAAGAWRYPDPMSATPYVSVAP